MSGDQFLRIAIIIDGISAGGAERQAIIIAAELARYGHDVHLVCYGPITAYQDFMDVKDVHLVSITARGCLRICRLLEIAKYLKRNHVQVVHAFKESACVYGRIAAKIAGVSCIFGGYRGETTVGLFTRVLNHVLTWNTAGWIVNSKVVRNFVCRHFWISSDRVYLLPNGLFLADLKVQESRNEIRDSLYLDHDAPVITMIARLNNVKNHDLLLRVADIVIDVFPEAKFLLIGDGPNKEKISSSVLEMGLSQNVLLLGQRDDIPRILNASDIVLLTSYSEGLPNALIEAAGSGIPVVSTANGGADLVIRDGLTGFLTPLDDEQAMSARVLQLLRNPQLRKMFGQRGKLRIASEFSAEVMAARATELYIEGLLK